MSKLKTFYEKLKKIKHIEIIIAVVVGLLVCAVVFSFSKPKNSKEIQNSTQSYSTAEEYVDWLENKLGNVLSKMDGVGQVNVIITLECGFSYEYATDTETKSTTSGSNETTVTTDRVVYEGNKPIVVKETYPVIKGVVVVAKGASDAKIKLNILTAVETVLDVDRNKITILY